jgi:hypothetical protein
MTAEFQIMALWGQLDAAGELAANSVAGAVDEATRRRAIIAWEAWLADNPWTASVLRAASDRDTKTAKSGKVDWTAAKAEAVRLGYMIPAGALSKPRMGQIVQELRALGARI